MEVMMLNILYGVKKQTENSNNLSFYSVQGINRIRHVTFISLWAVPSADSGFFFPCAAQHRGRRWLTGYTEGEPKTQRYLYWKYFHSVCAGQQVRCTQSKDNSFSSHAVIFQPPALAAPCIRALCRAPGALLLVVTFMNCLLSARLAASTAQPSLTERKGNLRKKNSSPQMPS